MYGVPQDLDLSRFKAATLVQLGIGEYQIQFHFDPNAIISVEGKWELRDSAGTLLYAATDSNAEREGYRVHIVLGKTVKDYSINPPYSFSLRFESGHELTVFDDSKQYESFSIQPGDIYV
jgi:hypothetical protein